MDEAENAEEDSIDIEEDDDIPACDEDELEELVKLLSRKGVYPYKNIDSLERLEEMQLPPLVTFLIYPQIQKLKLKGFKA